MLSISFVIPIHEESVFLEECVRSILAQVDVSELEIIIVKNDFDEDLSRFESLSQNVKVIQERRRGAAYARNAGLAQVIYDQVAFIDCDIVLYPDWAIKNYKLMMSGQHIACVQGKIIPRFKTKCLLELYRYVSVKTVTRKNFNYLENPHTIPSLNSAAILCRREMIREVGGFSIEMKRLEDTDLTYKLLSHGFHLGVQADAKSKVFNNHRSFYKYFKRSLHLGFQGNYLRAKWQLPVKKLMWASISHGNPCIRIIHAINFSCHLLGNSVAQLCKLFSKKMDVHKIVDRRINFIYKLNQLSYHFKESCKVIVFKDKIHLLDFEKSDVLVLKNFAYLQMLSALNGKEVDSFPRKILDFAFEHK